MTARRRATFLSHLASTFVLGTAAGAVWMAATLYLRGESPWLALPFGAALGWTMRRWTIGTPGIAAATAAAAATALAALYLRLLFAGLQLAATFGIGFGEALRTAGAGLLWQLARMALTPAGAGWVLAGMALALACGGWRRRPRRLSAGETFPS